MNQIVLSIVLLMLLGIASGELKYLMQHTRHGARAPIAPFHKLENITWTYDIGELTTSGMRQHYLLGREMRYRYVEQLKFLSPNFDPREVYVRSTQLNRTLQSAYSHLFGLFPFGTGDTLKIKQKNAHPPINVKDIEKFQREIGLNALPFGYSAVPVHSQEGSPELILLGMDKEACPYVEILKSELQNTERIKKLSEKFINSSFFGDIANSFGVDKKYVNISTIYLFADEIRSTEFEFPDYKFNMSNETYDLLKDVLEFSMWDALLGDDRIIRLATTRYFKYLIENLEFVVQSEKKKLTLKEEIFNLELKLNASNDISIKEQINEKVTLLKEKDFKFIYHSAHDTTLAAILLGLEKRQDEVPVFASHLMIELHKDDTKDYENTGYYVKIIYNDNTLALSSSCQNKETCRLSDFKQFISTRLFEGDIDKECARTSSRDDFHDIYDDNKTLIWVLVGLAIAVIFALCLLLTKYFINKRRSSRAEVTAYYQQA